MSKLSEITNKFKEIDIEFDFSRLDEDVRNALPFIRRAMDEVTQIFLRQQDESLPEIYDEMLVSDDDEKKAFYRFMKGPWNQLEEFKSVFPEHKDRAPGCAFYPSDLSKEKFESYVDSLPESERESFIDHYTVIRKTDSGLKAIPFHVHYADELARVFENLQEAASIVKNEELSVFLRNRAEALVSGNYRDSDAEWVKMKNSPIELVIGPFEVYADALMGIKATYEAMLLVIDREKGKELEEIEKNLPKLNEIFPVPEGSRAAVGGMAPMVVVNQIYSAGEAAQGIMASAFNLPNDPWVRGNVGWKQVMIHNVMRAKFETCTAEIAKKVVESDSNAEFDPYFIFVLLHEVSHGLGPAYRDDDRPVSKCLGSHYTAVEEAKADTGALYLMLHLGGECGIKKYSDETILDSYLAGLFRSMRFGVHEAHGAANVIQFNWFMEKGVIEKAESGKFVTKSENLIDATDELLIKLCELEATGTPEEAEKFLKQYAVPGKEITDTLEKLSDIPVDIRVNYPL